MAGKLLELLMQSLDSWGILAQHVMEERQAEAAHERLVREARQFTAVQRPRLWAELRSREILELLTFQWRVHKRGCV
jgi:hypothetical protein